MRDDPVVVLLVARARDGDKAAWDELVETYAPLVWSICRRFRLAPADAEDVGQTVWLRLVEHLATLREPAALPGWIATTAHRECLRLVRAARRSEPVDPMDNAQYLADDAVAVEDEVLTHERHAALRAAFAQLPARCQLLLSLLTRDPPVPYSQISKSLHMSPGSIGPNRGRCLERLRLCPALAALLEAELERAGGGEHRGRPMVG
jgi:RNA polymerase sigma factor (sigma-70 family)